MEFTRIRKNNRIQEKFNQYICCDRMKLFEKKKNVQFFGLNKEGVVLQYIDH